MKRRSIRQCSRGAALVEFAIAGALLFALLFGIVEMGLIFKDQATLAQAAREAARSLAVGSAPAVAATRAVSAATTLTLPPGNITLEKNTPDAGGSLTDWVAVGTSAANASANDANTGDLVRATLVYSHPLITSLVFANGSKQLTARVVMRRE